MVEKVHEYSHAQQHQCECHEHRQLWHEAREGPCGHCILKVCWGFVFRADRAEDQDRIDKGADERRKAELVASVFHEIRQEAWPIVAAGVGYGGDGDREHGRRNADHGAGYHRKHVAGAIRPGGFQPADVSHRSRVAIPIHPQGEGREKESGDGKQSRKEPVTGINIKPDFLEISGHPVPASFFSSASLRSRVSLSISISQRARAC